jgi:hypothetical protein
MDVTTGDNTEQLDDFFNTESSKLPRHDITAYYSGELGKLHLDWNGEAYLTRSNLRQQSHETESNTGDSRDIDTRYANKSSLYVSKLVGSFPLWKGTFTVGNELTNILRNNHYTLTGSGDNLPGNSEDRATETTVAAFASYNVALNKVNLSAGLRYEYVRMPYFDQGQYVDEQSGKYNNLFPSLSLGFPVGKVRVI